jgi:aldose 1-epimerase
MCPTGRHHSLSPPSFPHADDNAYLFGAAPPGNGPFVPQVTVTAAAAGLAMTVSTDQPSIQVYSGNFLDGSIPRKAAQGAGRFYAQHSALALETQQRIGAANDAANQPAIVVQPGATYTHHTRYELARSA